MKLRVNFTTRKLGFVSGGAVTSVCVVLHRAMNRETLSPRQRNARDLRSTVILNLGHIGWCKLLFILINCLVFDVGCGGFVDACSIACA